MFQTISEHDAEVWLASGSMDCAQVSWLKLNTKSHQVTVSQPLPS